VVKLLTDMFAKVLLVTSRSVVRSFAKNVGLGTSLLNEVSSETPRQNVSEGIVDDAEVSEEPLAVTLNNGSSNFQ
jgi:hypothetical protein